MGEYFLVVFHDIQSNFLPDNLLLNLSVILRTSGPSGMTLVLVLICNFINLQINNILTFYISGFTLPLNFSYSSITGNVSSSTSFNNMLTLSNKVFASYITLTNLFLRSFL